MTYRHRSQLKTFVLHTSIQPWCEKVNFAKKIGHQRSKGQRKMVKSKTLVSF